MRVTGTIENFPRNSFQQIVSGISVFERGLLGNPGPLMSNIGVCVFGILVDDGPDAFHDLSGVFLHLASGRRDEAGGTMSGTIFGQEMSV